MNKIFEYNITSFNLRSTWFGSEGEKLNRGYWSGSFICISPDCNIEYHCRIVQAPLIDELIRMDVICTDREKHNIELESPRKSRCSGENRLNLSLSITANGLSSVSNENQIYNHENPLESKHYFYIIF